MNPRFIMFWSLAALFMVLASNNPIYRLIITLVALNFLLISKRSDTSLKSLCKLLGFTIITATLLNTLLAHSGDHTLISLPGAIPGIGGSFTLEGLVFGLNVGLGIAAAILAMAPLSISLTANEVVSAMPKLLERTGIILVVSLGFVPVIVRNYQEIFETQKMRGWQPRGIRSWAAVLVPVVLVSMESSIQKAEAMEARGFGVSKRTSFTKFNVGQLDITVGIFTLLGLGLFIYADIMGSLVDWYTFPVVSYPTLSVLGIIACVLLTAPVLLWRSQN